MWKRSCQQQVSQLYSLPKLSLLYLKSSKYWNCCAEHVVAPSHESRHSHDSEDQDSEVDHEPIQERYGNPSYSRFRRVASKTIVSFGPNDPENPVNWRTVCGILPNTKKQGEEKITDISDRGGSSLFSQLVSCRSWTVLSARQFVAMPSPKLPKSSTSPTKQC